MSQELIGAHLGPYKIEREIASGATASVYEAYHEGLDRRAAIKVLSPDAPNREETLERFEREGRYSAKLTHEHITTVFDMGTQDDLHYLTMEFVEGRPLDQIIEEDGALQTYDALEIARQTAEAMAAAHAHSIIHRDIKPGNIVVNDEGHVKVMDFGVAKDLEEEMNLTQVGTSVGTRYYMSPEQIKGPGIDNRTDIFSLGVVLFEMLTGRRPYSPNLPFLDLMSKIVEGPFPSPRYVNPEVTETVEQIVLKMTATDADERYATAMDVAGDIQHCIRTQTYRENPDENAGAILAKPFKRLLGGRSGGPGEQERSAKPRRKDDRALTKEHAKLSGENERLVAENAKLTELAEQRYKEGRVAQRHVIRKNAKALLWVDCNSIRKIDNAAAPSNARVLDLSPGGAAILVRQRLERKSKHAIEFRLGPGQTFQAVGSVCWNRYIDKFEAYATGFEFVDMPKNDEHRLPDLLLSLRTTVGF